MGRASSLLVACMVLLGVVGLPGVGASTARSTIASAPRQGDRYVALGTSIASGFGISVQSTSCGRSSRSYPQLVAAHYKLQLVDVTCGAAAIPNVLDTPQGDNPPQISAVTPDTKLITVTVGGNDIGYNATTLVCGDPSTECSPPTTLDADLARARAALKDMLDKLKTAAPSAKIVFVTYPREIPRHKNCAALSYTDAEAAITRSMGEKLEAMFVDVAKRPGIIFVDPYIARGDHTACARLSQQWTAGHVPSDGFAYHPTALGHEVMAKMIKKALSRGASPQN